jgi:ribosomal protein L7Ae-like RNA K-turn-binding protein
VEKNLFQRAAKRAVTVDPELPARVERLLVGQCQGLLGLARRAGQLVTGFEQVRGFLASGRAAALVTARDAAPGGRAKLKALAGALPTVALLDVSELSLALGRQNVVHAALGPGGLAERFLAESARLAGFRDGSGPPSASQAEGDAVK